MVKCVQAEPSATTQSLFNYPSNDIKRQIQCQSVFPKETDIKKWRERKRKSQKPLSSKSSPTNPTQSPGGRRSALTNKAPTLTPCVLSVDYWILICTGRLSATIQNSILCLHIDIRLSRFNHEDKQGKWHKKDGAASETKSKTPRGEHGEIFIKGNESHLLSPYFYILVRRNSLSLSFIFIILSLLF